MTNNGSRNTPLVRKTVFVIEETNKIIGQTSVLISNYKVSVKETAKLIEETRELTSLLIRRSKFDCFCSANIPLEVFSAPPACKCAKDGAG